MIHNLVHVYRSTSNGKIASRSPQVVASTVNTPRVSLVRNPSELGLFVADVAVAV